MIGAIIIFTSLIKPSPSGLSDFPTPGNKKPTIIPNSTATSTCTYRIRYHGLAALADRLKAGMTISEPVPIWEKILHRIRSHVRVAVTDTRNDFKLPTQIQMLSHS